MTDRAPEPPADTTEPPEVSADTEGTGDDAGYPTLPDDDATPSTDAGGPVSTGEGEGSGSGAPSVAEQDGEGSNDAQPATANEGASPTTSGSNEAPADGDDGQTTNEAPADGDDGQTTNEAEGEPTTAQASAAPEGDQTSGDANEAAASSADDDGASEGTGTAVADETAAGDEATNADDQATSADDQATDGDDEAVGDDAPTSADEATNADDEATAGDDVDDAAAGDQGDGTGPDTDAEESRDTPTDGDAATGDAATGDAATGDDATGDDAQSYPRLAGEDSPEAGDTAGEGTESSNDAAEPPADAGYPQLAADDTETTPEPPPEPANVATTAPAEAQPPAEAEPSAQPAETVDPQEAAARDAMATYDALGDTPPQFDMGANDAEHAGDGAHTLARHSPEIPLARGDSPGRTVEGRIYGDAPWGNPQNWSYRWADADTMNRTVNEYAAANWDTIRSDLALEGQHTATFDAHRVTGDGYFNSGMYGVGPRAAEYSQARYATVNFRLVPGSDPPRVFVPTTYPSPVP